MTCQEAQPLLHAYLDGELDLTSSLALEQHLEGCGGCSAAWRKFELLRAEIADAHLDFVSDKVLQRLRASIARPPRVWWREWHIPAIIAAAAALVLALIIPARFTGGADSLDREFVDSHLRSLLAGHLIDVQSSDRHTVKPWFQGKIDFAPAVPDLTAQGFPLVGGRLDVIDTRRVAVLVYKRREHIINVWISQGTASLGSPAVRDIGGYHLIRWSSDGMIFRAASDLDVEELRTFAGLMQNKQL